MARLPVQVIDQICRYAFAEIGTRPLISSQHSFLRSGPKPTREFCTSRHVREDATSAEGDARITSSARCPPGSASIISGEKPYYVTTPIFYVNASPHIGHLHSLLLTDTLSRFSRLRQPSRSHRFATGTDEHGLKIQKAAEAAGKDPQVFCDEISGRFRRLAGVAGVGNTDFIRTSAEEHKRAVRYFWHTLMERGHIYKGSHSGWYAVSDESFYTESQVEDRVDGTTGASTKVAVESGSPVEWTEEENYKFRLSEFREGLIGWLRDNPRAVHPPSLHANLLNSLLTQPLQDLSISRPRSRLTWGVPVPGDEDNHTIYVWVDALVNYLTVLGYPWSNEKGEVAGPDQQAQLGLKQGWPVDVHIVGKDIVRFHAIYWPALLLAAGPPPPSQVLSHAHWTQGRTKMSKSKGNVVDPFVAMKDGPGLVGREGVRWYLMRAGGGLERDADYSDDQLITHYELLAAQVGNLLNRISNIKLLSRVLESTSEPEVINGSSKDSTDIDIKAFEVSLLNMGRQFDDRMKGIEVTKALEGVMEVVAEANKLFTILAPWKSTASPSDIQVSISLTHEALRRTGILLSIIMPEKMGQLLDRLGIAEGKRRWVDLEAVLGTDEFEVAVSKMILRQKAAKGEGVLFPPLTARP